MATTLKFPFLAAIEAGETDSAMFPQRGVCGLAVSAPSGLCNGGM